MKVVFLALLFFIGAVSASPTFWDKFEQLNSTALPGASDFNSLSTMVVDYSTTPYTGYFTGFRKAVTTGQMYKFRTDTGEITANSLLTSGDYSPIFMALDPSDKMLYYVPFSTSQPTIIKFDSASMSIVSRLELYKAPYSMTHMINSGVIDTENRTLIMSLDTNPAQLIRINLDTFTLNDTLTVANASRLSFGTIDKTSNMVYFGAKSYPTKVIKVDLVKWELVNVISLHEDFYGVKLGLLSTAGAVCDEVNRFVYISDKSDPGRIAKISIANNDFVHVDTLRLSVGEMAPPVMLLDQVGGNMIVGCSESIGETYTTPERVVQVDLRLFRRVVSVELKPYEVTLKSGIFDPVSRTCYFGTNRQVDYFAWANGPDKLVRIAVPAPCNGDTTCSYHGTCDYGACQCTGGMDADQRWSGTTCDTLTCPTGVVGKVCSDNGMCNNGTCVCTHDAFGHTAFGTDCFNLTCPNRCNQHGNCDPLSLICTCDNSWKGADCSIAVPPRPPCHELLNCSECFKDPSCGWCEASKNGSKCMDGTFVGPTTCYDWYYDACPDSGIVAFAWIIAILTMLLIAIGALSAVRDDNDWSRLGDDNDSRNKKKVMARVSWWRGSRTLKGWWMMDRLQMAALLGLVGVPMPSMYLSFIKPYAWTILGIQAPSFVTNALSAMVKGGSAAVLQARQLLSMPQYAASLTITAAVGNAIAIFTSAIFYFAILFFGVLLLLLLATLIAYFLGWTESTEDGPATLPYRIPGILIRIVLFAYTGLSAASAAAAFAQSQNVSLSPAVFGLSLVVLALLGLVFPTLLLLVFRSKAVQRKQFQRKFRMMFGCLYENYYFKTAWFSSVYLWKKWIIALMIGVFAQTSDVAGIACAATIMVMSVAYIVLIFVLKPFLDPMTRNLEVLGSLADILAGICILFFSPTMGLVGTADAAEFQKRNTITLILIVVQIVWVIFGAFAFFENWLRVHNVHSYAQLFRKLVGMRKKAEISGPVAVSMGNVQSTSHLD